MSAKLTTAEFIEQACSVHGEEYDYSRVVYAGAWSRVVIACRKHGPFLQKAVVHKMGSGCPKCSVDRISKKSLRTLDDFLESAKCVHGDRYDYSKSIYTKSSEKLIITCKEHGDFLQTPKNHTSNAQNCPECARLVRGPQVTGKDFIRKCIRIHGDAYDYSMVDYQGVARNVIVGCKIHGWFKQIAASHIQGQGCPQCAKEKRTQAMTKSNQAFIDEAMVVHGSKYDYSRVEYKNSKQGVIIGCPVHSWFTQSPATHLTKGCGCPSCSRSIGEDAVEKALLNLRISFYRQVKFSDCRDVRGLSYDFGLQYKNKFFLIEFDGIQHERPVEFFGSEGGLADRKRKDEIKTKFAIDNGYTLIRLKPEHITNMTTVIMEMLNA